MGTARQKSSREREKVPVTLPKSATGISGFDEITVGGLPRGRPSLVCGSAGCGKTLFAMEFLVRGATDHGEPGVFVTFEERTHELEQNVASLGFDLRDLQQRKLVVIDQVRIERSEIEEAGDYDLEGLFVRLGHAIDSIGAKRVALDTIEALFAGFSNEAILRAELRRLFMWLKERGVTAVITGERGDGQLTRQGLEEYVSDCVVLLDHRVVHQVSTRRLRIVKYRGSTHGTNEYPFLIDEQGINVLPVTSAGLTHDVSSERVSTGLPDLDVMLGGGIYQGASVLITGTPGTGKSTLGATFAASACAAGGRCLYFAFEESPGQIVRNMRSIGLDLERHIKSGRLRICAARPSLYGLETHLAMMHKQVREFAPSAVIVDPLSSLSGAGAMEDVQPMVLRLVDMLKAHGITAVFTTLTHGGTALEATEVEISSLMDTWILLRDTEVGAERNRLIYILKSRGTRHSNQVREYMISSEGIHFVDVSLDAEGGEVLTGSARLAQEQRMREEEARRAQAVMIANAETASKREALRAQIAALSAEVELLDAKIGRADDAEREFQRRLEIAQAAMAASRGSRVNGAAHPPAPARNGKSRRVS
jgi:circadian clock protein KaiC